MSVYSPKQGWLRAPEGGERTWLGLAILWCAVMSLVMPYWHFKGKQNSTGMSYKVDAKVFEERTERFVATNKVAEEAGMPVVEPAPGGDAYLIARMWSWYPILKLKAGQEYRLHIASMDVNHGFGLLPTNMNFQVVPGYDHILTITPTEKGSYQVICNEFCGAGHHLMTGKIIVE